MLGTQKFQKAADIIFHKLAIATHAIVDQPRNKPAHAWYAHFFLHFWDSQLWNHNHRNVCNLCISTFLCPNSLIQKPRQFQNFSRFTKSEITRFYCMQLLSTKISTSPVIINSVGHTSVMFAMCSRHVLNHIIVTCCRCVTSLFLFLSAMRVTSDCAINFSLFWSKSVGHHKQDALFYQTVLKCNFVVPDKGAEWLELEEYPRRPLQYPQAYCSSFYFTHLMRKITHEHAYSLECLFHELHYVIAFSLFCLHYKAQETYDSW